MQWLIDIGYPLGETETVVGILGATLGATLVANDSLICSSFRRMKSGSCSPGWLTGCVSSSWRWYSLSEPLGFFSWGISTSPPPCPSPGIPGGSCPRWATWPGSGREQRADPRRLSYTPWRASPIHQQWQICLDDFPFWRLRREMRERQRYTDDGNAIWLSCTLSVQRLFRLTLEPNSRFLVDQGIHWTSWNDMDKLTAAH